MRTITIPGMIIPASTVDVYTYDELPDTAKDEAFNNWSASEEPGELFNNVMDDIADISAVRGLYTSSKI